MKKFNWNYPTSMWVGENRVKDLSIACKNLNINNPGGGFYIDIGAAGFYGESMEGDWTLEVADYVAGTQGTITNYYITVYGN